MSAMASQNHQPRDCLLNRLFRHRWKKTLKLRVTGFCAGNSPVTDEFPHKRPVTRKMFPFDDVIMNIIFAQPQPRPQTHARTHTQHTWFNGWSQTQLDKLPEVSLIFRVISQIYRRGYYLVRCYSDTVTIGLMRILSTDASGCFFTNVTFTAVADIGIREGKFVKSYHIFTEFNLFFVHLILFWIDELIQFYSIYMSSMNIEFHLWYENCRRHFQMYLQWKCLNFDYDFTEVCSQGSNWL